MAILSKYNNNNNQFTTYNKTKFKLSHQIKILKFYLLQILETNSLYLSSNMMDITMRQKPPSKKKTFIKTLDSFRIKDKILNKLLLITMKIHRILNQLNKVKK